MRIGFDPDVMLDDPDVLPDDHDIIPDARDDHGVMPGLIRDPEGRSGDLKED